MIQDTNFTDKDAPRYIHIVMAYVSNDQIEEAKTILRGIHYIQDQRLFSEVLNHYVDDLDSLILILTSGVVIWLDDFICLDDQ